MVFSKSGLYVGGIIRILPAYDDANRRPYDVLIVSGRTLVPGTDMLMRLVPCTINVNASYVQIVCPD